MNFWIEVSQTDLQTKRKATLAKGRAVLWEQGLQCSISYRESDGTQVALEVAENSLKVKRLGEATSELTFIANQKTQGKVSSEYGDFYIEIVTHKYLHNDKFIVVEYDVMNEDVVLERFRFVWKVRREEDE